MPDDVTARLEQIKARGEQATEGPWKVCPDENTEGDLSLVCCGHGDEHAGPICTNPLTDADADFIAAARDDLPWAIAQIERLQTELVEAHEWKRQAQAILDPILEVGHSLPGLRVGGSVTAELIERVCDYTQLQRENERLRKALQGVMSYVKDNAVRADNPFRQDSIDAARAALKGVPHGD